LRLFKIGLPRKLKVTVRLDCRVRRTPKMPDEFGGLPLSLYRLYLMETSEGQIRRAVDIQATNDAHAVEQALHIDWNGTVELWQRARKVFHKNLSAS
jgi:hypothetical protein